MAKGQDTTNKQICVEGGRGQSKKKTKNPQMLPYGLARLQDGLEKMMFWYTKVTEAASGTRDMGKSTAALKEKIKDMKWLI